MKKRSEGKREVDAAEEEKEEERVEEGERVEVKREGEVLPRQQLEVI